MKALVLPDWASQFLDPVKQRHPKVEFVSTQSETEITNQIADAEILFGYPTSEQFDAASSLKWIQTLDAGMEGLFGTVPQVADSPVIVTNARGAGAPMIGEHAIAMMFALARQFPRFWQDKSDHRWDQDGALERVEYLGDKTAGIIGLGKSGREIAWRCKAIGMNVIAVDREPVDGDPTVELVWALDRLPDLLKASDYVVVTAPFSRANANMLGANEFAMMQKSARLVVTSRGRVFDNHALAEALRSGTIAGAALDSVNPEPLPVDSELWDVPNLIITPHIAGNSEQIVLDKRTFAIFAENLDRYLSGQPLLNVVDKVKQY